MRKENPRKEREKENVRERGREKLRFLQDLPKVLGFFIVCVLIGDIQNFHKIWIIIKIQEEEMSCILRVYWVLSRGSKEEFLKALVFKKQVFLHTNSQAKEDRQKNHLVWSKF